MPRKRGKKKRIQILDILPSLAKTVPVVKLDKIENIYPVFEEKSNYLKRERIPLKKARISTVRPDKQQEKTYINRTETCGKGSDINYKTPKADNIITGVNDSDSDSNKDGDDHDVLFENEIDFEGLSMNVEIQTEIISDVCDGQKENLFVAVNLVTDNMNLMTDRHVSVKKEQEEIIHDIVPDHKPKLLTKSGIGLCTNACNTHNNAILPMNQLVNYVSDSKPAYESTAKLESDTGEATVRKLNSECTSKATATSDAIPEAMNAQYSSKDSTTSDVTPIALIAKCNSKGNVIGNVTPITVNAECSSKGSATSDVTPVAMNAECSSKGSATSDVVPVALIAKCDSKGSVISTVTPVAMNAECNSKGSASCDATPIDLVEDSDSSDGFAESEVEHEGPIVECSSVVKAASDATPAVSLKVTVSSDNGHVQSPSILPTNWASDDCTSKKPLTETSVERRKKNHENDIEFPLNRTSVEIFPLNKTSVEMREKSQEKEIEFLYEAKKKYHCKECTQKFATIDSFSAHCCGKSESRAQIHTLLCPECEVKFTLVEYLNIHIKSCWKEKITCIICSKTTFGKFTMIKHLQDHKRASGQQCKYREKACLVCGLYDEKWNLVQHWREHTGVNLLRCIVCRKICEVTNFLSHLSTHQNGEPYLTDISRCQFCGVTLLNKELYENHKYKHTKHKYCNVCESCGMLFESITDLELHVLSHIDNNTVFKCLLCMKIFAFRAHFDIHTKTCFRMHKIKSIPNIESAQTCLRSILEKYLKVFYIEDLDFGSYSEKTKISKRKAQNECSSNSSVTLIGLRVEHKTDNKRILYSCQVCQKMIFGKDSFKVHWREHTGYDPNKCNYCKKSFPMIELLKIHMYRVHPFHYYKCSKCCIVFRNFKDNERHLEAHARKCIYFCEICGVGFHTFNYYEFHVFTQHVKGCSSKYTGNELMFKSSLVNTNHVNPPETNQDILNKINEDTPQKQADGTGEVPMSSKSKLPCNKSTTSTSSSLLMSMLLQKDIASQPNSLKVNSQSVQAELNDLNENAPSRTLNFQPNKNKVVTVVVDLRNNDAYSKTFTSPTSNCVGNKVINLSDLLSISSIPSNPVTVIKTGQTDITANTGAIGYENENLTISKQIANVKEISHKTEQTDIAATSAAVEHENENLTISKQTANAKEISRKTEQTDITATSAAVEHENENLTISKQTANAKEISHKTEQTDIAATSAAVEHENENLTISKQTANAKEISRKTEQTDITATSAAVEHENENLTISKQTANAKEISRKTEQTDIAATSAAIGHENENLTISKQAANAKDIAHKTGQTDIAATIATIGHENENLTISKQAANAKDIAHKTRQTDIAATTATIGHQNENLTINKQAANAKDISQRTRQTGIAAANEKDISQKTGQTDMAETSAAIRIQNENLISKQAANAKDISQ